MNSSCNHLKMLTAFFRRLGGPAPSRLGHVLIDVVAGFLLVGHQLVLQLGGTFFNRAEAVRVRALDTIFLNVSINRLFL